MNRRFDGFSEPRTSSTFKNRDIQFRQVMELSETVFKSVLVPGQMNNMSGEEKVVCVTGASGYMASWLVKLLLLRGYTVNATVRDLSYKSPRSIDLSIYIYVFFYVLTVYGILINVDDPKKVEHLLALEGAKERLRLFRAELTEEGSFDPAIKSCVGVFHTATPCFMVSKNPQAELVDPAVKGTINVLSSCVKVSSVKRVVLTSSISSMLINGRPITPDTLVDETWFSDPDFCRKEQSWYALSKILAEEAASEFAKEKGIDLVTICPGWILGPLLQPIMNTSSSSIFSLIGAETYENTSYGWAHVKDVADAHIQAFEIESASGRYCIVEGEAHFSEIVRILREAYPTLQLPSKSVDSVGYTPQCKFSRKRAESLGLKFIPFEVTLKEMIESFKEHQFIRL